MSRRRGPGQVQVRPDAPLITPKSKPPAAPPKQDESPTAVAIKAIQREAQIKLLDELIRECDPYNWSSPDEADAIANFREILKDKRTQLTT